MFVSLVYAATVALFPLRSFVSASPLVTRSAHGVWNPPITAPRAGDVWIVGSPQTVTWDASQIPPSAANKTGTLLLGYYDGPTENENLYTRNPLAHGFPLIDGVVHFEVPDVRSRDTYLVVLMGNSGNASPEFTINNPHSTSAMTHRSSRSSDKAVAQKDSNDLVPADPNQLPPDFPTIPVSPAPIAPEPPVSDPKIDPVNPSRCPECTSPGFVQGTSSNLQ